MRCLGEDPSLLLVGLRFFSRRVIIIQQKPPCPPSPPSSGPLQATHRGCTSRLAAAIAGSAKFDHLPPSRMGRCGRVTHPRASSSPAAHLRGVFTSTSCEVSRSRPASIHVVRVVLHSPPATPSSSSLLCARDSRGPPVRAPSTWPACARIVHGRDGARAETRGGHERREVGRARTWLPRLTVIKETQLDDQNEVQLNIGMNSNFHSCTKHWEGWITAADSNFLFDPLTS